MIQLIHISIGNFVQAHIDSKMYKYRVFQSKHYLSIRSHLSRQTSWPFAFNTNNSMLNLHENREYNFSNRYLREYSFSDNYLADSE